MSDPNRGRFFWWRGSRYGFAAFYFLSLLAGWFGLRLGLFITYRPAGLPLADVLAAFLAGFERDFFSALLETLPMLLWLFIIPDRTFLEARWHRFIFLSAGLVCWFVQVFLLFVEFFFFDEFKSRFNTVAVDYLLYPKEVFVNIWESYHVGLFLAFCFILSLGWL